MIRRIPGIVTKRWVLAAGSAFAKATARQALPPYSEAKKRVEAIANGKPTTEAAELINADS